MRGCDIYTYLPHILISIPIIYLMCVQIVSATLCIQSPLCMSSLFFITSTMFIHCNTCTNTSSVQCLCQCILRRISIIEFIAEAFFPLYMKQYRTTICATHHTTYFHILKTHACVYNCMGPCITYVYTCMYVCHSTSGKRLMPLLS